ncbi:MAG: class I SAM-dependent methyltransferase [Oscillospiraceae bacterium]|nr:class I SAM-dependent methyltransferase [Oscillospiraceae bacterium]
MNEERFTGKADIYKKYRPSYPKEFIDYLYCEAGLNQESIIADIGSGTGIFSRLLLERGSKVYCVEPNEDMRQTAEQDLTGFENFISVNANASDTKQQDKSVDFVTAAQAFHWFDRQEFKSECQRILKPGGKVIIVFNGPEDCEFIRKRDSITEKYASDKKGFQQRGESAGEYADFFADGIFETKTFRNDLQYNFDSYIGRELSRSYTPKEETNPEKYHGLIKELGELFDEYSINGILNFPHFTISYVGRV